MKETMLKLSAKLQTLMLQEEGQDLIEYALVVALIAFAATASMKELAGDINTAFTNIGTTLTTYTGSRNKGPGPRLKSFIHAGRDARRRLKRPLPTYSPPQRTEFFTAETKHMRRKRGTATRANFWP